MIQVTVNRKESGVIQSFEISGHAFFAERGNDIVCAGVSAVSIGAINAVHALIGITPEIEQKEDGFLRCVIPEHLPEETNEKIQLLLEGMVVSLQTIEEQYGQHIKMTFKKQEVE
ncbi:ribosomal-processing cysteine protease Prp [Bacillus sp. DTU_2020_1000418_1_SI_GHA_SEK_038]|uniref:ribosomal-processing cysteine protease Prp n=1 Tax=Bacillus sp. DTU_2020_1000418_1_SI_GHA_SEK_038 TaxID=3077585 RepID=UPI0028ECCE5D|nr:ribosomal-processing cysteine protease Prp [Bacillus sp. DTU_2020_1000418_1_SI_GHA_SEK_038]WNS74448.1 ribosomal-processing cysteine protease Prp [Bacillus sp. DTU_2020_1000418_1_SI_GHA_SEK_038]